MSRHLAWTSLVLVLLAALPAYSTGQTVLKSAAFDAQGQIGLQWEAVPGALGYRVYYGPEPGSYNQSVDVGKTTEASIDGLKQCTMYYAAVKAYNAAGESTFFSNEVSGWARPAVTENDTTVLMQGGQYVVNLTGSNFNDFAQLEFDVTDIDGDPLIHVDSFDVVSCNEAQALLSVEPQTTGLRAMQIGSHSFHVVNPDGVVGSSDYEVQLNPTRLDINRSEPDTQERINGKDLVWLSFSHGAAEGEDRYSPDADLTGDGFVDGEDLAHLASVFGSCWDGAVWDSDACP